MPRVAAIVSRMRQTSQGCALIRRLHGAPLTLVAPSRELRSARRRLSTALGATSRRSAMRGFAVSWQDEQPMGRRASLGLAVALVYALFSYAGIRSPDGEVMYRTAEAIARAGEFSIEPLEQWPDFGVAAGRDGAHYGKYGPALPLLASPLAWVGLQIDSMPGVSGLATLGPSHFCGDGLAAMVDRRAPSSAPSHVKRSLVSLFNVVVGAFAAIAMLRLLEQLGLGRAGVIAGSAAFAFGTPMLAYSGTFFSEPLVTLCLLSTLAGIAAWDTKPDGQRSASWRLLEPGAWLGLAVAAHLTAALWLPFLGAYVAVTAGVRRDSAARIATALGCLALGTLVAVGGLLAFNVARFGSVVETGRPAADYAFVGPWNNIVPLLTSWGKGIFVLCPLTLLGLFAWPQMIRGRPGLGLLLIGGVAARVTLFASFHDWHGGFGPGPRYPLPEIAVLALGAGLWLDGYLTRGRRHAVLAVTIVCACIAEQSWIASGEVFSWCHRWRAAFAARGASVFVDDLLDRDFTLSPLAPAFGLNGMAGPAIARALDVVPAAFAVVATFLLCVGTAAAILRARRGAVLESSAE